MMLDGNDCNGKEQAGSEVVDQVRAICTAK